MQKLGAYSHFELSDSAKRAVLEVKLQVLEEPLRFDMTIWAGRYRNDISRSVALQLAEAWQPPCGTAACMAGWLSTNKRRAENRPLSTNGVVIVYEATQILNIPFRPVPVHIQVRDAIFFSNLWPTEFGVYDCSPRSLETIQENAQIGARYIDYIVEHGIPYK